MFGDQSKGVCDATFIGPITTGDEAEFRFETFGFFKQDGDSNFWTFTSGIKINTENEKYAPLENLTGIMAGTTDLEAYQHSSTFYLPV